MSERDAQKQGSMGLLAKAKLLEMAKEQADTKKLMKQALKEKIISKQDEKQKLIKSSFAQKLDNGQYVCLCCNIKFPDYIYAVKHFNTSQTHKQKIEEIKSKLTQRLDPAQKEVIQTTEEDQSEDIQSLAKVPYQLIEEEEILENDESDNDQQQMEEKQVKKSNIEDKIELQKYMINEYERLSKELKEEVKQEESQLSDGLEQALDEEYETRLMHDIDEMEQVKNRIDQERARQQSVRQEQEMRKQLQEQQQKKEQLQQQQIQEQQKSQALGKKRVAKISLNELLKDADIQLNIKRKK